MLKSTKPDYMTDYEWAKLVRSVELRPLVSGLISSLNDIANDEDRAGSDRISASRVLLSKVLPDVKTPSDGADINDGVVPSLEIVVRK